MAGAFGSQRYNCHTKESDMDMFVVYRASTDRLLGFNPPQQTVKVRASVRSWTIFDFSLCTPVVMGKFQQALLLYMGC